MSAVRIEKLKHLLSRVQERRAAPRLSAVSPLAKAPNAEPGAAALLESSEVPTSAHDVSPVLRPEVPASAARAADEVQELGRAPTMGDLPRTPVLDVPTLPAALPAKRPEVPGLDAAAEARETPAEAEKTGLVERPQPAAVAAPSATFAMQGEEVPLTAPSARVEAAPVVSDKPVVRAVSSPNVEAPKSFGDLLEASLSLRPRA